MRFSKLKNYELDEILSSNFQQHWKNTIEKEKFLRFDVVFNIYRSFIDITEHERNKPFDLKNIECIDSHFKMLIGFIYCEFDSKYEIKYKYAKIFLKLFIEIFKEKFTLHNSKFSSICESKNVVDYIKHYLHSRKNLEKIEYYKGWYVNCSEGHTLYINLTNIYKSYGKIYTSSLLDVLKIITSKRSKPSSNVIIINILKLYKYFIELYPNLEDLNRSLNSFNAYDTMLKIYNLSLIDTKIKEESFYSFHERWRGLIFIYYEMVDLFFFEKPVNKIQTPIFKSNDNLPKTNLRKSKNQDLVSIKLITDIPISYSDSQAKELIFEKILIDINYIVNCSKKLCEENLNRFNNYIENSKKGEIILTHEGNKTPSGPNNILNVCATYNKFPFIHPDIKIYLSFLGYSKNTKEIEKIIPLSNCESLYPFLILLINEHPCITPSALINWKLYSKGKNTGLYKVGDIWVTTMFKKRKGSDLAEQTIILNDKSKKIIEDIIKMTSIARFYLKSINDNNYEYMLLKSSSLFTKPEKFNDISNLNENYLFEKLKYNFLNEQLLSEKINFNEAEKLVKTFTLTKFRASCGVRVYLNTTSVERMSEALGHEKFEPRLMVRYLPTPLWTYFTNRWIRIFQNALIFEAMKDSKYLYQAIDLTPAQLDLFLTNHSLGEIPKFLEKNINLDNPQNDYVGVFPISVALLQWLIAIVNFVDFSSGIDKVNKIAFKWYQAALLVLSYLEVCNSENHHLHINQDVLEMYEIAKKNPLDFKIIARTLECKN